jgi:hypothetical protein
MPEEEQEGPLTGLNYYWSLSIQSQKNPVHKVLFYVWEIHFILSQCPGLSKTSSLQILLQKDLFGFIFPPMHATCTAHVLLLQLYNSL